MKAALLRHIIDAHGGRMPKSCRTVDAMVKWHQNEHHRYAPNHYHEGENRGPGSRPPGWKTGEGAVPRR